LCDAFREAGYKLKFWWDDKLPCFVDVAPLFFANLDSCDAFGKGLKRPSFILIGLGNRLKLRLDDELARFVNKAPFVANLDSG
jgi:hypothetical protein